MKIQSKLKNKFKNDTNNNGLVWLGSIIGLKIIFDWQKLFYKNASILISLTLIYQISIVQASSVNISKTNLTYENNSIVDAFPKLSSVNFNDSHLNDILESQNRIVSKEKHELNKDVSINVQNNAIEEELEELTIKLQNMTEALYQTDGETLINNLNCSCGSFKNYIKNQVFLIVQQVKLLKQVDPHQNSKVYQDLNSMSRETFENFQTIVKSINSTYTQKILRTVNDLRNKIEAFPSHINISNTTYVDIIKSLCILKIRDGKHESALIDFKILKKDTILIEIIKNAYEKDLKQFEHLIEFLKILPSYYYRILGFETLFVELNDSNTPMTLIILDEIQKNMNNDDFNENSVVVINKYTSLEKKLKFSLEYILSLWSKQIRLSDYDNIVSFSKRSNLTSLSLSKHFAELVQKVNLTYFESTLELIQCLTSPLHIYKGYKTLMRQMREYNNLFSSDLITLAFNIKRSYERNNESNYLLKEIIDSEFPDYVKVLMSDKPCTFKNRKFKEYLYLASYNYDTFSGYKTLFTWIPGYSVSNGHWKLTSLYYNNGFQIKNSFFNDLFYLYESDNVVGSEDSGTLWKFYPTKIDDKIYFKIKSPMGLFISTTEKKQDVDRRHVILTSLCSSNCDWEIMCLN